MTRGPDETRVVGFGNWGATLALPDGRLMMWEAEGKTESDLAAIANPNITERCVAKYSSDDGRTWTDPVALFEFPKGTGAYIGPNISLVDRDGVIHLFGLHFFGYDLQNYENWEAYKCYAYHVMSADGGKTWTQAQHCEIGYPYTGSTNSVIQTKTGRIVLPVSYYSKRKTGRFVCICSLSDDGGKTWRPSKGECVVDTGGTGLESGACEPVCIQLKDGRIVMMIRTQGGYQYEAYSSDDGNTWAQPVPSRFVSGNSPGSFLRLRDGRIVFVWNNSPGRDMMAATISDDEGRTWKGYRQVSGAGCYPILNESADGTIIVHYFGGGPGIGIVRVQPDWIELPSFSAHFNDPLTDWVTTGTDDVASVASPEGPGRHVLSLRKPAADKPAGALLNFPFAAKGELAMTLRLEPGFRGARICLTDYFTPPGSPQDGRFAVSIDATGAISAAAADGKPVGTGAVLSPGKWHTLIFAWDATKKTCTLSVDGARAADLKQLSPAPGVCYLRLLSTAEQTDEVGLLISSVRTRATGW